MGKPKRKHPDLEEILARPWCYYCERDFDDLKILINHQKAKHFKCERCGRRLNTAGGEHVSLKVLRPSNADTGLSVHMTQVHKESLASIENALPNRAGLDVEIFGMEGIPEDIVTAHQQRVIGQFAQAEAERRAATGNAGPGASGAGAVKKPKFESPSDLKKRLAEHKAKKAAEQAAGISSGDATPIGAGYGGQSPGQGQNSNVFVSPISQSSYSFLIRPRAKVPLAISKGKCSMVLLQLLRLILPSSSPMVNSPVPSNSSHLISRNSNNLAHSRKLRLALAHLVCLLNSQIVNNMVHRINSTSKVQASRLPFRMGRLDHLTLLPHHHFSRTNFNHHVLIRHLKMVFLHVRLTCRRRQVFLSVPL